MTDPKHPQIYSEVKIRGVRQGCGPPNYNVGPRKMGNPKKKPYMGVSKNNGTPKSSILIGFSIINHPFWGTPIFGNTHITWVFYGFFHPQDSLGRTPRNTILSTRLFERVKNPFYLSLEFTPASSPPEVNG